jgi:hypothetical protein
MANVESGCDQRIQNSVKIKDLENWPFMNLLVEYVLTALVSIKRQHSVSMI